MLTDLEALTLTIWGEARGEPIEGKIGVAMVMRNRWLNHYRGAGSYVDVCTAHAQFSAWTDEAEEMTVGENEYSSGRLDVVMDLCKEIATATIMGLLADNTHGANHYYADSIAAPTWAVGATLLATLGHHRFYNVP